MIKLVKIKLGEYLESQKIPITWLHEKTGIRYGTLWNYTHNKTQSIKFKHLTNIMDTLGITDIRVLLDKD